MEPAQEGVVRHRLDDFPLDQAVGPPLRHPAGVAVGGLRAGQGEDHRLGLAVALAGPPRRGRSVRAASGPAVANRRRMVAAIPVAIPSAISSSVSSRSVRSSPWTRFRCRRVSGPMNRFSKAALGSSVNRMTYRFSRPAPPWRDRRAIRLSKISAMIH